MPSAIFKKAGLEIGQKVVVTEENGNLIITPAEKIVEKLAGSVPMPEEWRRKDIDEIIEEARDEYYKEKIYSR